MSSTCRTATGGSAKGKDLSMSQGPRRGGNARETAEALFKKATTRPVELASPKPAALPAAKEAVSIRIDRDVLVHFQEGGPGWQDRINVALRKAAGLS
jgi:uncharacterized protein (DUF4415 family)